MSFEEQIYKLMKSRVSTCSDEFVLKVFHLCQERLNTRGYMCSQSHELNEETAQYLSDIDAGKIKVCDCDIDELFNTLDEDLSDETLACIQQGLEDAQNGNVRPLQWRVVDEAEWFEKFPKYKSGLWINIGISLLLTLGFLGLFISIVNIIVKYFI